MKRTVKFLYLLLLLVFTLTMNSCVYDFNNHTSANGESYNDAPHKENIGDGKITSLQMLFDSGYIKDGSTIDLSAYPNITDFEAKINKAVTIENPNNKDFTAATLTVEKGGVSLNGLKNANVIAAASIDNGSLKIAGSTLKNLNILGGGINSIHLTNCSVEKTEINKVKSSNKSEFVRLAIDKSVTINQLTIKSSVVIDSGTSVIERGQLPSVDIDVSNAEDNGAISLAVSSKVTFTPTQTLAKVLFGDKDVTEAQMSVYVIPNNSNSIIKRDFFDSAFEKLVGKISDLKEDAQSNFNTKLDEVCDKQITNDKNASVQNLVETITVHFVYNDDDNAKSDFTFPKGKKLDVSSQGMKKSGYALSGWATSLNGSIDYKVGGNPVELENGQTYYFIWEKKSSAKQIYGNVWTYSDKIENISTVWTGTPESPKFSVLLINKAIENDFNDVMKSGRSYDPSLLPDDEIMYQIRKDEQDITFITAADGTWPTDYSGVCAVVENGNYTLYVDKSKLVYSNLKAFGQIYADEPESYAHYLTSADEYDLSTYYPVVIALTDESADCFGYMWNGYVHKMETATSYPSAETMPKKVTFDIKFTGSAFIDAFNPMSSLDGTQDSIEWTVKNVTYYEGLKVPFNFQAGNSGQTNETAQNGATLNAHILFTDGIRWEAYEAPIAYQQHYAFAKKCNIGTLKDIWLGFNGLKGEFDIETWNVFVENGYISGDFTADESGDSSTANDDSSSSSSDDNSDWVSESSSASVDDSTSSEDINDSSSISADDSSSSSSDIEDDNSSSSSSSSSGDDSSASSAAGDDSSTSSSDDSSDWDSDSSSSSTSDIGDDNSSSSAVGDDSSSSSSSSGDDSSSSSSSSGDDSSSSSDPMAYDDTYTGAVSGLSTWWETHQESSARYYVKITGSYEGNTTTLSQDITTLSQQLSSHNTLQIHLDLSEITGVTSLPSSAFDSVKSLIGVTLPEGLTKIDYDTFRLCSNLAEVHFPSTLQTIESQAFYDCPLNNVTLAGNDDLNTTIPLKIDGPALYTRDGKTLLLYLQRQSEESFTVPDDVEEIAQWAFNGAVFSSITFNSSLTTIGNYAFAYCDNLNNVAIPDNVTTIGTNAFAYCSSLSSVTLPSNITRIESSTFASCALSSINIPNNVEYIGDSAFWCANFTSITLPSNLKTIDKRVFGYCRSLTSITLPAGLEEIGEDAFDGTSLTTVNYRGTSDQKAAMTISDSTINNITWNCDYTGD